MEKSVTMPLWPLDASQVIAGADSQLSAGLTTR